MDMAALAQRCESMYAMRYMYLFSYDHVPKEEGRGLPLPGQAVRHRTIMFM